MTDTTVFLLGVLAGVVGFVVPWVAGLLFKPRSGDDE